MTTIYDIKKRAQQLSEKTDSETISPQEVGGLFSDMADYTNDVEVNGSSLGIRKTYTSVSAMEADKNPVGDDGKPLKKGQLVNIYNQDDPSSADNNKVFSWQNPGWQIRTTLDAGYATREELTELENKTPSNFIKTSVDVKDSIINIGWLKPDNTVVDDSRWKYGYVEVPAGALSFYLSNYSLQVESAPAIVFLNTDNTVISYLSYRNKTCIFGNIPEDCTKIGFSVYSSKVETFRCEFRSNYTTDKNIDTELANLYNEINPKLVFPYILETGLDVKEQITETGWVQSSGEIKPDSTWKNGKILIPSGCKNLELNNWDSEANGAVNIILLGDNDSIIEAIPMSTMPLAIKIPLNAKKVHLSVRNSYINNFKILFLGYTSNEFLQDDVENLKHDTTVVNYIDYSDESIKRLNGYAYTYGRNFFVNEYTDDYWYTLYKLLPNVNYALEQKQGLESVGILAGFIGSEEDFVLGGKIKSVVMSGNGSNPLQNIEIESSGVERLLVVLGTRLYENSRVQLKQEESTAKIKDKLKELESTIANINGKEQICCPDKFYAVVGQEFNLYYDGLIKGLDAGLQSPLGIYIDIQCPDLQNASNQIGVRRERMWQITGSKLTSNFVGEHDLYISAYDSHGVLISKKTTKLIVKNATSLTSQKYILCIGDSLTNNGPIVATCGQHFQNLGGTQPIFIGQRTTSGYKHEGYPGYTFSSFTGSSAGYSYRIFDVPSGTNVSVGDKYSTNGRTYIIMDIRTEGLDNKLRLRCEISGSGGNEPTPTGTLTKVSGSSSSAQTIEYSAYEQESGNPFWDYDTGSINFSKYREKMGMGGNKFDLVVIMLGTNDCIINSSASMQGSINNAITLINAILSDAGDYSTKIIIQMTPSDANTISSWQVYRDSSSSRKMRYWNNLWILRKLLYEEFSKPNWNNKVFLGQAALGLDRYYGFPYEERNLSSRISTVKEIFHLNCVHPNVEGYQQLGDGYYLQALSLLVE